MTAPMVDESLISEVVARACHAPSLHNSQPWRWVFDGTSLHLYADFGRYLPAADRDGRELLLSCGAALDHLRVALAALGWGAIVEHFPDADEPNHVASVRIHHRGHGIEADHRRSDAILHRWTDRLPFAAPSEWPVLAAKLARTVAPYGVMLDVVNDTDLAQLEEISRDTESVRRLDIEYQDELHWWTSPFGSGDRIPQNTLVSTAEAARVGVARGFPPGEQTQHGEIIDRDQAQIVVLSTDSDDGIDLVHCGEALSAVLLDATVAGMATCTVSHVTEFAPSRAAVRKLLGHAGDPQLLIRIGESRADHEHLTPVPRRPLSEVLEFHRVDDHGR